MRFDPIEVPLQGPARVRSFGRRPAPALSGACAALAATALLLALAACLLVSSGILGWPVLPLALALFMPVAGFVLWRIDDHPHARFGPANVVTTLRGGMAALVGACVVDYASRTGIEGGLPWGLVGTTLVTLSLDGVDGFLARRTGLASRFGARFDMEVDAFLILLLCALAYAGGKTGAFVFAIGSMRYAFVAWARADPRLARPLAPSLWRKTVCVLQIAILCVVLLPPVVSPVSDGLAVFALVLLVWSFAVDIRLLLREGV